MWSGGISNPLFVIEQLTYLLFIKRSLMGDPDRLPDRLGPLERLQHAVGHVGTGDNHTSLEVLPQGGAVTPGEPAVGEPWWPEARPLELAGP